MYVQHCYRGTCSIPVNNTSLTLARRRVTRGVATRAHGTGPTFFDGDPNSDEDAENFPNPDV